MSCAASGKNLPIILFLMLYPVALKIEAREVKDLLRLAMLLAEHPCSQSPQFNIILFLQTKGLRVIDNRGKGGGVWVVGGSELSAVMQTLAAKGIHFKLYPGGLQRQLGPTASTTDGWFIKSL